MGSVADAIPAALGGRPDLLDQVDYRLAETSTICQTRGFSASTSMTN
jgi:hypothetical protein